MHRNKKKLIRDFQIMDGGQLTLWGHARHDTSCGCYKGNKVQMHSTEQRKLYLPVWELRANERTQLPTH